MASASWRDDKHAPLCAAWCARHSTSFRIARHDRLAALCACAALRGPAALTLDESSYLLPFVMINIRTVERERCGALMDLVGSVNVWAGVMGWRVSAQAARQRWAGEQHGSARSCTPRAAAFSCA